MAVKGSCFTYAECRIVLFSKDASLADPKGAVLKTPAKFFKLATAKPKTAPCGAAAVDVMCKIGVPAGVQDKIVRGDNIAQTYQFVYTGNAQRGFVAYSQLAHDKGGSRWVVPQSPYDPVRQDAVLLKAGAGNKVAKAFLVFLKGKRARAIMRGYGYGAE